MKPVLFVTGHAPAYRIGAFARLAEREHVELALFGGPLQHGGERGAGGLPFPHRHVRERDVYALAASGDYRAVICSTAGRVAPLGAWAGARRARVPLLLWASLWAHPRTLAHAAGYPALRWLYRSADALVTYGPHVSTYVCARGGRNVHEAPQAVDNDFWGAPEIRPVSHPDWPCEADVKFLFAGRPRREKGMGVLFEAWSMSGLQAPTAALVLVGAGSIPPWVPAGGAVIGANTEDPAAGAGAVPITNALASVVCTDTVPALALRDMYAAADVLVVPSIPTRTFREPWGLVVNEAMNRGLPVIASDAVGAAAGGLVRDGRNGLVVGAGDPVALAAAIRRLAADRELRARLGAGGREDVAAYSFEAWGGGFSRALASVQADAGRCREGVR